MKKRCNIYIEEDNIEFMHQNNKNMSQLIDKLLANYVKLMKMSENELVQKRIQLNEEIIEKKALLDMIDEAILSDDRGGMDG